MSGLRFMDVRLGSTDPGLRFIGLGSGWRDSGFGLQGLRFRDSGFELGV